MNKKLVTVLAAGTLLTGVVAPFVANAIEVDPWEKAANDYLTGEGNAPVENPAPVETPKEADAPKPAAPVEIDEQYVKDNIDTPTGPQEKAKEDAYKDAAEAKYKEDLKKQGGKKQQFKKLPKTSAVK